jgi:hypothetical protein
MGEPAAEQELEETGNYPDPEDGPQDDVDQARLPAYDDDLIGGATLEDDQLDVDDDTDVDVTDEEE